MLRLRVLGGASLTRDGQPLLGAASQGRRIALLTVIATAGAQGISRDTLLALLWPESPEDRARHALSQWLFLMRRDLGVDDLVTGSRTLQLNGDRITTDVAEFDSAIAAQEWSAAATLYRGPLLDGLLLSNAPEFQQWLDRQRNQRRLQAMRAVGRLAQTCELTDPAQAIAWWQRLAVLDPHSGPTALRIIRLLAGSGDIVAALAFARRHEEILQSDLELSPSAEVAAVVDGLRNELLSRARTSHALVRRPADDPYVEFVRDRLASRFIIDSLASRSSLTTSFSARVTADLTPITLKVFLPDLLARTDRPRLLALLRTAAALQHENIESPDEVAIAEGIMYLAVADERSTTLRDALEANPPLAVSDVIAMGGQIAAALAHAHDRGLLHGNLTPRRIAVRASGVRLTELGVLPALSATLTRLPHDSGFPSGNPSYMSPEQLMGDDVTDAASDIYSLGCVLYQLLTGQLPHAGSTTRATLAARLREPAAAMRAADHRRPDGLDALIASMLERRPGARPTASHVGRVLSGMH